MNPLHDAEQVVGRITNSHRFDLRYRIRFAPPEPIEVPWKEVAEIIGGMLVFGGLMVGLFLWLAIAEAARV
jgi:hypothetical protein